MDEPAIDSVDDSTNDYDYFDAKDIKDLQQDAPIPLDNPLMLYINARFVLNEWYEKAREDIRGSIAGQTS